MIPQALAAGVTINPTLPGMAATSTLQGWVNGFYSFALMIAGILAFGAIVYGGVRYAVGKGNPSSESEGKSWITSALLGLLLLGVAYVILATVNPQIVAMNIPGLPAITPPPAASSTANGLIYACTANNNIYACSPGNKFDCSDTTACAGKTCAQIPSNLCGSSAGPANAYQSPSSSSQTAPTTKTIYTCGGDPPNSRFGTCPPTDTGAPMVCVNVNGGTTKETVKYMCQTQ